MASATVASVFGPNENATADNAFISNAQSAWDKDWRRHAPHENRFFVAVPYADYLDNGEFNPDNARIPWHGGTSPDARRSRTAGSRSPAASASGRCGRTDRSRTSARVTSARRPRSATPTTSSGRQDTIPPNRSASRPRTPSDCARASICRGASPVRSHPWFGTVNWRFVDAEDVPEGALDEGCHTRVPQLVIGVLAMTRDGAAASQVVGTGTGGGSTIPSRP